MDSRVPTDAAPAPAGTVLPGETEERLRLALDSAGLGWWHVDLATGEISHDERFRTLVGLAPGESLEYEGSYDRIHPDDRVRVRHAIDAATRAEAPIPYDMEYRTRLGDGAYRWLHSRGQAYFEDGQATRFVGTVADIEGRKQAEAAERETEMRYRTFLEAVDSGYCVFRMILDRDGVPVDYRFTETNPAFERQTGLVDAVGRTALELVPNLEQHWFDLYGGVARTGEPARFQQGSVAMGRVFDVYAFRLGGEGSLDVALLFTDITAQKTSEAEREGLLREVEAEKRKLELAQAQSLAFIAIMKGPDLVFDYVNAPFYGLVGHRDVLGKTLAEALPEVVSQGFPELLRRVMETGEALEMEEVPATFQRSPDSSPVERFVSQRYSPIIEPDGSISGVYAHGMDVTEAAIARRTLAARAEETAIGSRRKDEFLATLAHELRNPLAPIRLSTELLGILDPAEPEFEEARTVIGRQVDYMVRLVDDLLDVSRVAQGKIKLQRETVDVAKVVRAAIETSQPGIEAGGHTLEVSLPDSSLYVYGDATRLAQVLANLLNNSAKYTPRGGNITLSAAPDEGHVVLSVRDNGIGIPSEMLPAIFDMFAQVEVHLVQSQGGLGIGLTLSRRLVELHGGTIEARSEGPGKGSEFLVRLPLVTPSNIVATDIRSISTESPNRKILVVDDNVDGAWTLAELLRTMGHEVRIAHTGAEALAIAPDFEPGMVLLDLGLPDMPGYEVARRFRADPILARAHLVAQTGWGREEDRALGRDAGFDDHLVKPLARADLERVLAQSGEPRSSS